MSVEVKPDEIEGTPPPSSPPQPSIQAAVSLKLPPFWPNDPTLWFAQVEAQFLIRNITTQETRFACIIGSLQPEVAQEVRDILISPPSKDCYTQLKAELIRHTSTSTSEQKRLHQLLIVQELGDCKPSQLQVLRRMRQLLGENTLEEKILKQLFLQRLPTTVQSILASTTDTVGIEALADLAYKIVEVSAPSIPHITTVSAPPLMFPSQQAVPEVLVLQNKVDDLTRQVQALTSQLQGGPEARPFWYHWKYGANARKCTSPCSRHSPQRNQENSQASD